MKTIGDRISYWYEDDLLRIVIKANTDKTKEGLLFAWLMAWLICIGIFMFQLAGPYNREEKLFFVVLIIFMGYFFFRLYKVWGWRKFGKELITISADKIMIKRDRKSYGKAYSYFQENVKGLGVIIQKETSFKHELEKSFWVIGGETVGFESLGTKVKFGLQLSDGDAKQLAGLIKDELRKRKAVREN